MGSGLHRAAPKGMSVGEDVLRHGDREAMQLLQWHKTQHTHEHKQREEKKKAAWSTDNFTVALGTIATVLPSVHMPPSTAGL